MNRAIVSFIILASFLNLTNGNIRFVCPRPISFKSDHETVSYMLDSACDKTEGSTKEDVLTITPGPFTIRFEETKFQLDSPFRIILLENSKPPKHHNSTTNSTINGPEETDEQSCVLLDHIPHNNQAIITQHCSQNDKDDRLGICSESTYYITVRIPDISCQDCTLQLVQIIPGQGNKLCDVGQSNETGNATECVVYFSCARVRISPTSAGSTRDMSFCADYLRNLPGDWPYRPEYMFKTGHGAALTYDITTKNLHIKIPSQPNMRLIERVEVRHNFTVLWNDTVKEKLKQGEPVTLVWRNLSDDLIRELMRDSLVLNIVDMKESIAADINYIGQHFTEGQLGQLYDRYSEQGWLSAERFFGQLTEDPLAAFPVGPCAPPAKFFMASLQSVHVTAHGIIGMTVIENRAYISAVLHVEREEIETITISGPSLVGIPPIEINVPPSFSGVLLTAVDISQQILFLNTVKFLRTASVKTDKEKDVLAGDLEEGMFAVLRDEGGHVRGMGSFQFTQGQWLKVDIVLNDITPTILSVVLLAPDQTVLADLSRETSHCTATFCCVQHVIQELSSQLILHLIKGQVLVSVATVGRNVTGTILGSLSGYCNMVDGACQKFNYQFSLNGIGIDDITYEEGRGTNGKWQETETYVLDRANVFHYCIQVENMDWTDQNYSLKVMLNKVKIDEMNFTQHDDFSHTFLACKSIPLGENSTATSPLVGSTDMETKLSFYVGHKKLSQEHQLPSIYRSKCIVNKIHVVGKEHSYWGVDSVPIQDILAVVSDTLKFITEKNTTVYLMKSKQAYDNCEFTGAVQFTFAESFGDKEIFIYPLTQRGSLYFADLNSCNTSMPLKVAVQVIAGVKTVQDNEQHEWCLKSIYSVWRDLQMKTWNEPEVSGPILIGLLVGLASGGVFLAWQGARMKRFSETFRGHNDNVFVRF